VDAEAGASWPEQLDQTTNRDRLCKAIVIGRILLCVFVLIFEKDQHNKADNTQ